MRLLTQPYLLSLNPANEMNIVWIQLCRTPTHVEFGSTPALGNRAETQCHEIKGLRRPMEDGTYGPTPAGHPEVSVWQYIAKIENLSPGETVYFRCCYGDEYTKTYFFHTAPPEGEEFRFTVISDLQALPGCDESVYQIGRFHPDVILFAGDATYESWHFDHWFDNDGTEDNDTGKRAFFACMQQENGARLMQYAPTFVCPGNHELDNRSCTSPEECNWSVFMQMFRPLYPDMETGPDGRRWYSANYGDMHIISLNVNRVWLETGFYVCDSIAPDSPQIRWLENDLKNDRSKYKWVITHFHLLSKAWDAKFHLCDPVTDAGGNVTYPHDYEGMLRDLFSRYGINGVSYGHSHVYERYCDKGTHYIEAAYLSVTFSKPDDTPHPSGLLPVAEDNSRRSFMIAKCSNDGIFVTGYYADSKPVAFDEYQVAD